MKVINSLLVYLIVFAHSSCSLLEPRDNGIPNDIDNFVSDYSFNKQRATELLFTSTDEDVYIFWVQYGEGVDCPSGCIYSKIIGLKTGEKVGWFEDNYFPGGDSTGYEIFYIQSGDSVLFDKTLWESNLM